MKIYIPVIIVLLLVGCAEARTLSYSGLASKRQYNDVQADLYMVAPCDMTIGAFHRRLSPAQQRAVTALCGGENIPVLNPETGLLE